MKNVPLSMAPKESQDAINEFGRPEYEQWLKQFPHVPTLDAKAVSRRSAAGTSDVGAQQDALASPTERDHDAA